MQNKFPHTSCTDDVTGLLHHLDDVLDRERQALLKGDLDAVSRGFQTKESLIEALAKVDFSTADKLGALQHKAAHNQQLLNSALNGIRAVSERIGALRKIRDTLETYDETGKKTVIDGTKGKRVERRA